MFGLIIVRTDCKVVDKGLFKAYFNVLLICWVSDKLDRLDITIFCFMHGNLAVNGHLAAGLEKRLDNTAKAEVRFGCNAFVDSRFTDIPRTSRVKAGKE